MSSCKKMTCKRTLRQGFICLRHRTPYPPLYTSYACIQYTYSHRKGGTGRIVEPERLGNGNSSQSWVENTNMTINSDKNLPQSPSTGQFF
jgi:hypothetical protein